MAELTDIESWILKEILEHGCCVSEEAKKKLNISKPKKALTKQNFPNIRNKLYSYMTAFSHGMYRGGFQWVSVIDFKGTKEELKKLINN